MKFELSEFKGDYGTDEVLDWIQKAQPILCSAGVPPHAHVEVVVPQLRHAAASRWRSLCI